MISKKTFAMKNSNSNEVSTIFHPKKCRPSVLTHCDEQQNNEIDTTQKTDDPHYCNLTSECINNCRTSDSINSSVPGNAINNVTNTAVIGCGINTNQCPSQNQPIFQFRTHSNNSYSYRGSLSTFYQSCCAALAKKIYFGVCVTIFVTASWVGATHSIKFLYFQKETIIINSSAIYNSTYSDQQFKKQTISYNAPFFTTWFCTNWTVLYFPVYFITQIIKSKCSTPSEIITESLRGFRDKGLSGGRFLTRCSLFCGLWVATNYMYIHSLRILLATDVMTLFATNVACVYLLSWVILHEQFVGVRIVAVILCDTGIALLAYMDGITGSPTLGGVVLAASAAAGSAVYKVLFKKVIGDTTFGEISLFFSIIGICNAALLWPICLVLYFSGVEYILWEKFPWIVLLAASILHLALDVILYGAHFMGMKLAGMILIAIGFFLVMFPNNWPDYFTRLLRWSRRHRHGISGGTSRDIIDYRTGYIKSHLRSPSGRVR
ncbi:PREDICTED: putative thiamine transporter SLC35F3 isoform X2 [Ceratosolen solmsi marchali]|uniref:Thiamine transporter SLC35F3 isoform X2 n=1 Tax=Ceratosolen solmsi marchali TaxID=326594 RepID=A0AAJ6YDW0_9HYME|nr:PREDICTED: putative thiamine transporter SLC35F3 isoform X2 [Ceratosolen solmsi marchali]